jgi:hypothetical protein
VTFKKYFAPPIAVTETEIALGRVSWNVTARGGIRPHTPIVATTFRSCPVVVEDQKRVIARGRCVIGSGPRGQTQLATTVNAKFDFKVDRQAYVTVGGRGHRDGLGGAKRFDKQRRR